jgi:hypothetical protein
LQVGDVVVAPVFDRQEGNPKRRPNLVLKVFPERGEALVVSITSTFDPKNLLPFQIDEIPWRLGVPKACTGLTRPSVIDCDWSTIVPTAQCQAIGYMPKLLVRKAQDTYLKAIQSQSDQRP